MNTTTFTPGEDGKSMVITRSFQASLKRVWDAWTRKELLEKWWAPAPWKAVTLSMDFSEGGEWHYYMQGPEGDRHYCLAAYKKIQPQKSFSALDAFCDEQKNINQNLPTNEWFNVFQEKNGMTQVTVNLTCKSVEDLKKLSEMGFKEGFSQGLDQLEALLRE